MREWRVLITYSHYTVLDVDAYLISLQIGFHCV
jgi:hypothetical protein